MCRPRSQLVSLDDTPYYHVVSRCVRRTFLCGVDHATGQNYEHRREWIETRILFLSSIFTIDIAAYAVMSNHYHIVVKLVPEQINALDDKEILCRWCSLYQGPDILRSFLAGEDLTESETVLIKKLITTYRQRLTDLGWFMKCLNEPIARQANTEDECTGHFWESRFKSQALRTEKALLSCMAYVDLNPVRAGMAKTPEQSEYTSVKQRILPSLNLTNSVQEALSQLFILEDITPKPLLSFKPTDRQENDNELPIELEDYLTLVDLGGRALHPKKRSSINEKLPPILSRIDISDSEWIDSSMNFEANFRRRRYRKTSRDTV